MASRQQSVVFPHGSRPEGAAVVEECPTALGFLLAAAIRDLSLRMESDQAVPGGAEVRLAAIRTHIPGHDLADQLLRLARLVADGNPFDSQSAAVACREVKDWASARAIRPVQREFAHLLARLVPDDLSAALEAGRLIRDSGDHAGGEIWFREVIVRARRLGDWSSYVWGYMGLGVLYHTAGNHPAASVVFHRARRTAHRHGLLSEAGSAHHHLFTLAAEGGRTGDVYLHLEAAFQCYGRQSPRLPSLVHDAARFWIDTGNFKLALPVLEAVCPILEPHVNEYTLCRANLAWAAAGVGDLVKYEAYEEAAVAAVRKRPREEIAAEAYLHLGYALELLGHSDSAEGMAGRARELSVAAGALYVRVKVDELLERLCGTERQQLEPRPTETSQLSRRAQRLARELAGAVST